MWWYLDLIILGKLSRFRWGHEGRGHHDEIGGLIGRDIRDCSISLFLCHVRIQQPSAGQEEDPHWGTGLANILLLDFPASLIVKNKFLFISVQGTQFMEFYLWQPKVINTLLCFVLTFLHLDIGTWLTCLLYPSDIPHHCVFYFFRTTFCNYKMFQVHLVYFLSQYYYRPFIQWSWFLGEWY